MAAELWWLYDNEREQGHGSGQMTPDGVVVAAASVVVLVNVTGVACVRRCAESRSALMYMVID